jgi:hypothetical protein
VVKTELELNGRTVVDATVDGIDMRDYPDFCDAYFDTAFYEDNNTALTDDELNQLTDDNPDTLHEMVYDQLY